MGSKSVSLIIRIYIYIFLPTMCSVHWEPASQSLDLYCCHSRQYFIDNECLCIKPTLFNVLKQRVPLDFLSGEQIKVYVTVIYYMNVWQQKTLTCSVPALQWLLNALLLSINRYLDLKTCRGGWEIYGFMWTESYLHRPGDQLMWAYQTP